jgi:L-galactonate dehydratase
VADTTPEEVVRCIDYRYITDDITPDEAVQLLHERQVGKAERMAEVQRNRAVSAYTTSTGWLGYSQEKMQTLLRQNLADGFNYFKLSRLGDLSGKSRGGCALLERSLVTIRAM